MKNCLKCEAQIDETDKYCSSCGQVVTEGESRACPGCGCGVAGNRNLCGNCGFDFNENHPVEETQMAKEVLELMHSPVRLSDFKHRYPYLTKGKFDTVYVRVIEKTVEMGKSVQIAHHLASFPRSWGIQKVGLLRRFITLFIDWPIVLAMFLGGLAFFIGSAVEPGILGLQGGGKTVFAWAFFFISYFLYFAGTEFILGASIGGLCCGVRVVDEFGNKQRFSAIFKRNLYKLIPLIGPHAMAPYVKPDHEVVKY